MNFLEYSKIINETAVYPKSFGPAYTVLGLVEESWELQESIPKMDKTHSLKETGDVLWYLTATMFEYDLDLEHYNSLINLFNDGSYFTSYSDIENLSDSLVASINKVTSMTKKYIRDGNINKHLLNMYMEQILIDLCSICDRLNSDIYECMKINYDKLIKRRETNTIHGSGDNREEQVA